jgi:hypothetical protein
MFNIGKGAKRALENLLGVLGLLNQKKLLGEMFDFVWDRDVKLIEISQRFGIERD